MFMKKILSVIAIVVFTFLSVLSVRAGNWPPPPPGGGGGNQGTQRAPVGEGIVVMLALGAAYGMRKMYRFNKEKENE